MAEYRNLKSVSLPESHPSTPRQRSPRRGILNLVFNKLTTPVGFFIIVLLSFALGYICRSQTLVTPAVPEPPPPPPPPPNAADLELKTHNNFSIPVCGQPLPAENIRQAIIDRVFSRVSPWDEFPPNHVISDGLLVDDWKQGWGSNAPVFEHLIQELKPKTIIEVGTFLGASATHMADLTQKLGLQTQILCIDDFRGWPGYFDGDKATKMLNGDSMLLYQFMQNVVKSKTTDSIMFLPFSASTALSGLCEWGVFGDLVEVDAAHDFHSAWVDINNAYKVVRKPNGILFGHDYVWEGVQRAVHIFAQLHGLRVEIDGEHWVLR